MEIRVLRYFLDIAREGNMTKAAARLHISQPTLSRQMKALEQELGKKLFIRSNYSVKLSDEGMLLWKQRCMSFGKSIRSSHRRQSCCWAN